MILVLSAGNSVCTSRAQVTLTNVCRGNVGAGLVANGPSTVRPRGVSITVVNNRLIGLILYGLTMILPPIEVLLLLMISTTIENYVVEVPRPFAIPI